MEPDCRRAPAYLLRVLFLFAVSLSYSSAFPYDRPSLGDVYSEYTDLKPTDLRHGIFNDLPQVIIPLPGWLDKHRHHNTKEQNDKTEQHEVTGYRGAVGYYDTPGPNIIINIYPIEISFSESDESYEESKSSSEEWPRSSEEKTSSSEEWQRSSEEKTSSSEEWPRSSEEKPSSSEEWPRSSEEKPSSSEKWPRSSEEKPALSEEKLISIKPKLASDEDALVANLLHKHKTTKIEIIKVSSSSQISSKKQKKPYPLLRKATLQDKTQTSDVATTVENATSQTEAHAPIKKTASQAEAQKPEAHSPVESATSKAEAKKTDAHSPVESTTSQAEAQKPEAHSPVESATSQAESQIPAAHSPIKKQTSQAEAQKPEAHSPETQVPPVTKKSKHCSFKHLSSCYVVADMLLKFDDCSKSCQNSSYDVVVPKSAETKAFLHKQMGGSVNTLSRTNIYPYWLGIKFTNNAWHLHAKSSEAVGYSNWVPDTPMSPSNDACAAADLNDSLWRISECTDVALCVCESSVQQSKR
ncbi:surface protein-like [Physella acuta]|uniref:surface protein-like n=1 Tax=Physella acuta TaxID=109671 RepID=UPI0027DD83A7|nr:surface protein-like [Physella acuta]